MTADTDLHPLAQNYLERLSAAARILPVDEANELVSDISDHLRHALSHNPDEAGVRTVLDRLGTPRELVTAAGGPSTPPQPAPAQEPRFGAVEILALAGLVGAELLFFLFPVSVLIWLGGIVMLALSRVWSGRQKAWGTVGLATGFPVCMTALLWPVTSTRACTSATTKVSTDGSVVTTPAQEVCTSTSGLPAWASMLALALLLGYLCLQVWTLWRLTRRR